MTLQGDAAGLQRFHTNVRGLDDILGGGLFVGGTYLLIGPSGAGKTILASEIAFRGAAEGPAVFMTVLTESPGRMLTYLSPMAYFDASPVGDHLYFVSGYDPLLEGGLTGLSDLLFELLRERRPRLLVLDGLFNVEALSPSEAEFRRFIHDVGVMTTSVSATTILIDHRQVGHDYAQFAMVDGIIELLDEEVALRSTRQVAVRKIRGSGFLRGRHHFEIDAEGVFIHPRSEQLLALMPATYTSQPELRGTGVPELDRMLGSGLLDASVTVVAGPTGSGKTVLGMQFLAEGASAGEHGLYFGFYEPPEAILRKAEQHGLRLDGSLVEIHWDPPLEIILDAVVRRIMDAVAATGSRRVFVDGLNALEQGAFHPERLGTILAALGHLLRAQGVACMLTLETLELTGIPRSLPFQGLSPSVDNLILLRNVEASGERHRILSVVKTREQAMDLDLREYFITPAGITVARTADSARQALGWTPGGPP